MLPGIQIRRIQPGDNHEIAIIIRNALTEFGANRPGTVFTDPTTDHLFELFMAERSAYFVADENGFICGGAGIYPTKGLGPGICEFVKMYLKPTARGKGIGGVLIRECISFAKKAGYRSIYIESMPELKKALGIYEKFGFRYLDGPLGESGHTGCSLWMLLDLD